MLREVSILLSLVFLVGMVSTVYVPYICRRRNQVCGPPGVPGQCLASGVCLCPAGYTGYDCTLRTAQIVSTGCNVNCQGHGTCYNDGSSSHKCYCDAEYYGDSCDFNRVSVKCAVNNMTVRVFPLSFNGEVFVNNIEPSMEPACLLEPATDGNGLTKTLSFEEIRTTNPCAPNLSVATKADGTQVFTYELMARYSQGYSTAFDEIHTITCEHTLNGPLLGRVVTVSNGQPGRLSGATVTGNTTVVDFDITRQSDGVSVASKGIAVAIGDELNLELTLAKNSRYDTHRVENCGVYNLPLEPIVNPLRAEKQLVADGCPADKSLDVIRGAISKNDNIISIPITAFKFNTGELYFYCSVRVCENAGDPLCQPTDCSIQYGGPGSGYGRKRRQAGDEEEMIDVERTIFVVNVVPRTPAPPTHKTAVEESCLKSPAFLAITCVFAALLLVVLIVTIILVTRYLKREKELSKGKYSDTS